MSLGSVLPSGLEQNWWSLLVPWRGVCWGLTMYISLKFKVAASLSDDQSDRGRFLWLGIRLRGEVVRLPLPRDTGAKGKPFHQNVQAERRWFPLYKSLSDSKGQKLKIFERQFLSVMFHVSRCSCSGRSSLDSWKELVFQPDACETCLEPVNITEIRIPSC